MGELPLAGFRVLDLGVVLAGPQATLMLADLGAEVIRVESTQHFASQTRGILARPSREFVNAMAPISGGYPNREPGERPWNRFPWFNATARNKLGMTVDLEKETGREIFKHLIMISDALITNQAPGTLEAYELGYDALARINPQLIYVEASSFGATGPFRNFRALGLQMEAFAGHDLLRHYPDRDVSSNTWAVTADAAGALAIAFATQLGLYARMTTGKGQYIDISMIENFVNTLGPFVLDYTYNNRVHKSLGNRHYWAIQGCYPCAGEDRWVVLTIPDDAAWQRLCHVIGDPSLATDSRFATVSERYKSHDEIDKFISAWTCRLERDEVVARLRAANLMVGPVLDDADAYRDPHLLERGFFLEIHQTDTGTHRYPGPPYKLCNAEISARYPPVRLGEHNDYIYKKLLGYSEDEYAYFEGQGHIGMDYAGHIR